MSSYACRISVRRAGLPCSFLPSCVYVLYTLISCSFHTLFFCMLISSSSLSLSEFDRCCWPLIFYALLWLCSSMSISCAGEVTTGPCTPDVFQKCWVLPSTSWQNPSKGCSAHCCLPSTWGQKFLVYLQVENLSFVIVMFSRLFSLWWLITTKRILIQLQLNTLGTWTQSMMLH